MQIIHSGGTNGSLDKDHKDYDKFGFGNYFMLQLKPQIDLLIEDGKKIAVVVAAKPNKEHFHPRFVDMGYDTKDFLFLGREDRAEWGEYDAIFLLGGNTAELHRWLKLNKFHPEKLLKCELLGGDSAGSYVLAAKTMIDYEADGSAFEIVDGFLPYIELLVAAHVNNEYYHQAGLDNALSKWCIDQNIAYLRLAENEMKKTLA